MGCLRSFFKRYPIEKTRSGKAARGHREGYLTEGLPDPVFAEQKCKQTAPVFHPAGIRKVVSSSYHHTLLAVL